VERIFTVTPSLVSRLASEFEKSIFHGSSSTCRIEQKSVARSFWIEISWNSVIVNPFSPLRDRLQKPYCIILSQFQLSYEISSESSWNHSVLCSLSDVSSRAEDLGTRKWTSMYYSFHNILFEGESESYWLERFVNEVSRRGGGGKPISIINFIIVCFR